MILEVENDSNSKKFGCKVIIEAHMHFQQVSVPTCEIQNTYIRVPTIGVKQITGKFHFGWTQWIVRRKCQTGGEDTSLKTGSFWTPVKRSNRSFLIISYRKIHLNNTIVTENVFIQAEII